MSIEENRARYEGTALQALMEASGHTICGRCYCCDSTSESATCPSCGGMCGWDEDDDFDSDGWCDTCEGEGQIYFQSCLGRCDENGNHKPSTIAQHSPAKESAK